MIKLELFLVPKHMRPFIRNEFEAGFPDRSPPVSLSALIPGGVVVLPAPQNLSVQSVNMKHLLTWSPVIVPGEIVYYSVEYQG